MNERQRWCLFQYTLSTLFLWVAAISLLASTSMIGLLPLLIFGVPTAALIVNPKSLLRWDRFKLQRCLVLGGIASLICWELGRPVDAHTWLSYLGPLAWFLVIDSAFPAQKISAVVTILFAAAYLSFFFSLFGASRDLRIGMVARITSPSLRFRVRSESSRVIRHYLGSRKPCWRDNYPVGHEVEDHVLTRSIVFEDELSEAIAMFPSLASRKQVLECLTEPQNLARAHQGLLVACIYCNGYPKDMSAEAWWKKHNQAFVVVTDPVIASAMVVGWRERGELLIPMLLGDSESKLRILRRQLHATIAQERGQGGSDLEIAELFLRGKVKSNGTTIAWWE